METPGILLKSNSDCYINASHQNASTDDFTIVSTCDVLVFGVGGVGSENGDVERYRADYWMKTKQNNHDKCSRKKVDIEQDIDIPENHTQGGRAINVVLSSGTRHGRKRNIRTSIRRCHTNR